MCVCVCIVSIYILATCIWVCFPFNDYVWNMRWETEDNKYATETNVPNYFSASLNMVQIENRPLKRTLQVLHMLSPTLRNIFPLFAFHFRSPSLLTCNLKINGKSRSNGTKTSEGQRERLTSQKPEKAYRFQRESGNFWELVCHLGIVLSSVLTSIQCLHQRQMCC